MFVTPHLTSAGASITSGSRDLFMYLRRVNNNQHPLLLQLPCLPEHPVSRNNENRATKVGHEIFLRRILTISAIKLYFSQGGRGEGAHLVCECDIRSFNGRV